eukprot:scaffold24048_cov194-Amphora_coffeaeformis.AAC.25
MHGRRMHCFVVVVVEFLDTLAIPVPIGVYRVVECTVVARPDTAPRYTDVGHGNRRIHIVLGRRLDDDDDDDANNNQERSSCPPPSFSSSSLPADHRITCVELCTTIPYHNVAATKKLTMALAIKEHERWLSYSRRPFLCFIIIMMMTMVCFGGFFFF